MRKLFIIEILILSVLIGSCMPLRKIAIPQQDSKAAEDSVDIGKDIDKVKNTGDQSKDGQPSGKVPDRISRDTGAAPEKENKGLENEPQNVKAVPKIEPEKPQQTVKSNTSKASASSISYIVRVDISDQKVYVYKGSEEIKAMTCSTGIKGPKTETPEGNYKINGRGKWFFSEEFQQGGKFWVGFIGGEYLFHSVPADRRQNIIEEEAAKLGTPASHGCVRLSVDDAYWFFNNIPDGSKVEIVK